MAQAHGLTNREVGFEMVDMAAFPLNICIYFGCVNQGIGSICFIFMHLFSNFD